MITTVADLQAALTVGGDVVCDPTVTLDVTGAGLTVGLPTRLLGGSFTCSAGPAFTVTTSQVEIAGVAVTGPGGTTYDGTQKLLYLLGTSTAPLTAVDVHDCHLTGSAGHNVWAEWCVNSGIHNNTISTFLGSGVMVISGDGVTVADNVVSDGAIPAGGVEVYGIAVTDLANTTAARSRYCTVTGNRVHEIDWEGIDTHGGHGIAIVGNVVTACRRGLALVTGNATRITAPSGCVVSGNVVDGTGARVTPDIGVFLTGLSGTPCSATVTGNQITGYDTSPAVPISTLNWDRANTVIAVNSRPHVPWTAVTLSGGWVANGSFPPQYAVDGNTVSSRGGAIPPTGGIASNPVIGSVASAAAWPAVRTFYATTKGSNTAAGVGVLNVDTNGALRVDYGNTPDTYTYWLTGSYQAV